ncbi:MAG: sigma-70 family RNA polymerase sigma factor [Clostridia bacterium]|nr:sigma-70 family RNA polymerase sigma factor [Clostridia bacterium]MBP5767450.1 sigma-70 family RNA polymerase sigma factor [Clostridia bacterium]
MESTADNIICLRKRAGVSQQELADSLFVSRSLVSMWEIGKRVPDRLSVSRMAEMFGVAESDIVGDSRFAYASEAEVLLVNAEIGEFTDSKDAAQEAVVATLSNFLADVSERDHEIFVSRYFYMKTNKTIADELDMNESTVRNKLSRMRKKLKRIIERGDGL